jgi:hypothetical protein
MVIRRQPCRNVVIVAIYRTIEHNEGRWRTNTSSMALADDRYRFDQETFAGKRSNVKDARDRP